MPWTPGARAGRQGGDVGRQGWKNRLKRAARAEAGKQDGLRDGIPICGGSFRS